MLKTNWRVHGTRYRTHSQEYLVMRATGTGTQRRRRLTGEHVPMSRVDRERLCRKLEREAR